MRQQCPCFLQLPFPIRASNAQALLTALGQCQPTAALHFCWHCFPLALTLPSACSPRCRAVDANCSPVGPGSPASAGCPQPVPPPWAQAPSPRPAAPDLSRPRLFLYLSMQTIATKMQDAAPEQGRGFSSPPWGWACVLSASLGIGCGTGSNHSLQCSDTDSSGASE